MRLLIPPVREVENNHQQLSSVRNIGCLRLRYLFSHRGGNCFNLFHVLFPRRQECFGGDRLLSAVRRAG